MSCRLLSGLVRSHIMLLSHWDDTSRHSTRHSRYIKRRSIHLHMQHACQTVRVAGSAVSGCCAWQSPGHLSAGDHVVVMEPGSPLSTDLCRYFATLVPPIHYKYFECVNLPCTHHIYTYYIIYINILAYLVCYLLPGYRQVRGCGENGGAEISAFPLAPENDWRPDLAALEAAVTKDTQLIAGAPATLCACSFRAIAQSSTSQALHILQLQGNCIELK